MSETIMVSIFCNTYNHERYIKDALESFLKQKTNFNFEVLVHDDASTDRTADIIREYEKKYPELIKPIYQTENQYSKKQAIISKLQNSRVKGKYIAFCEGDDYWTDDLKLQKQYDAMEAHPEFDMCAHGAVVVGEDGKTIIGEICPKNNNSVLTVEEVIKNGGGYISTNSLFYRKILVDNIPEFRMFMMIDHTLQIQGSLRGGILYLSDKMSAYRKNAIGSWTVRNSDSKSQILHIDRLCQMLEILDKNTDFKYHDAVYTIYNSKQFQKKILQHDFAALKKEPYLERYKQLSFKRRIKFKLIYILDFISKKVKHVK